MEVRYSHPFGMVSTVPIVKAAKEDFAGGAVSVSTDDITVGTGGREIVIDVPDDVSEESLSILTTALEDRLGVPISGPEITQS